MWFILALVAPSFAATLMVAADGSGDYATVTEALGVAATGDTILVGPGTYAPSTGEALPWYFPTSITVEGAGPEFTVFDAEGEETFGQALNSGVTLSGIAFTGTSGKGIEMTGGDALVEDCSFTGNADTALTVRYGAVVDSVFRGNSAIDPGDATAIYGAYSSLVRVEVYDEPDPNHVSVDFEAEAAVDACLFVGGAVRILGSVTNSLFLGLQGSNFAPNACYEASLFDGTTDWFENNTVVGCTAAIAVYAEYARNNVIAHNVGAGIEASYAAYNLTWDNAGGDWSGTDWSGTLNNITADPLFRNFSDDGDWTNDDFRLDTASPGIDSAAADCPDHDLIGVPRPQDGDGDGVYRCDMGAYEWGMIDEDGDGWYLDGGDCDDTDPEIHPDAEDIPYDGIDQDCDGSDLVDVDGDGYAADHQGGLDCDDTDAGIHPGAWDIPNDGIDQDCDGADAVDSDGDGWPDDQDCDPDDPDVHPGADEVCGNDIDDDCDGEVDEDCDTGGDSGAAPDTGDTGGEVEADRTPENDRLCGCGACRSGSAALLLLLPVAATRRRHR